VEAELRSPAICEEALEAWAGFREAISLDALEALEALQAWAGCFSNARWLVLAAAHE
jgi:hypothetical protein